MQPGCTAPHCPPCCHTCSAAEGILLCDAGTPGWRVRYGNTALAKLAGLSPRGAVGVPFWQLFELRGGMTHESVQEGVAAGRPFTVRCALRAAAGQQGGSDGGAAGPSSQPGAGAAPGAAMFSVTFTPATAPTLGDELPIGIPLYPPGGPGSPGQPPSAADAVLWFATVQSAPPPAASHASGALSSVSEPGSPPAAIRNSIERLRPANMLEVELGPLLGVGASGRCAGLGG